MLILHSKLLNLPVIELENQKKVASVIDLVIEPKNGKLLGLLVRVGAILPKNQLVAARDINQLLPTAILVGDTEKITEIDEVVRVKELYKKKYGLIGRKVVTKSGKMLGKINDFLIDSDAFGLTKIYVRNLFSDRIIPYSAVIKMDKVVTVKDDFEAISILQESKVIEADAE